MQIARKENMYSDWNVAQGMMALVCEILNCSSPFIAKFNLENNSMLCFYDPSASYVSIYKKTHLA
jgi:hypothetical protein